MRWYHLTCYLFQHLCVPLWRWISDTSITFHHQVKCSGLWWRPKSVCVCVSESCGDVAEKLGVIFPIYYITHYIFFAVFSFYPESSCPLMTLLQMLVPLASRCTTGAHLLQLGSGALAQCVQAVASESELTRKSPVWWRTGLIQPLLPRPQWPHCLLHINKPAGPPDSRQHSATAANWEARANSHIPNDTISQLEARARQEISAVR